MDSVCLSYNRNHQQYISLEVKSLEPSISPMNRIQNQSSNDAMLKENCNMKSQSTMWWKCIACEYNIINRITFLCAFTTSYFFCVILAKMLLLFKFISTRAKVYIQFMCVSSNFVVICIAEIKYTFIKIAHFVVIAPWDTSAFFAIDLTQ